MDLWAGLECTFNRVGDRFADQCQLNGHDRRSLADLQRFASLGVKRIRYPVLWEKVAPSSLDHCDFSASDSALAELRALGLSPIVGLVHHGSGPAYTSLLDAEFPDQLARYAAYVAERYPWVDSFTPVNEPLTTARFSALYGVWYPHKADDRSFFRALYHELRGTVLAMRAIRRVNPSARLVQTEDLGRATSTEPLAYQAEFENLRRWLTFDFLCGAVDRSHGLFTFLRDCGGLTEDEILWFAENPCPPDIIGVNHYPLSNRFLDHRVELYPEPMRGGNGRDEYVDIGAVDTGAVVPPSVKDILLDVWERYRLPVAVTEAHIAGPREAQMRWLNEVWTSARELEQTGARIVAVCAWSLLGSYNWSSLCTAEPGFESYESGVFDTRMGEPRPTVLAGMISSLARNGHFEHPLLVRPGYWKDASRIRFAPPSTPHPVPTFGDSRPILITGAGGHLAQAFTQVCAWRGIEFVALDRSQLDIASREDVVKAIATLKPWAVINAAGFSRIESAERNPERAHRENVVGVRVLAEACEDASLPLLTFSSDQVFSGEQREPYTENSTVSPLNTYGRTKAAGERAVLNATGRALIIRTSSLFSPWNRSSFLASTVRDLRAGSVVHAVDNIWSSPTYVTDLVHNALDLLIDGETGLLHLANESAITWGDFARMAATSLKADSSLVVGVSGEHYQLTARRPSYSALRSERMRGAMPPIERVVEIYVQDILRGES